MSFSVPSLSQVMNDFVQKQYNILPGLECGMQRISVENKQLQWSKLQESKYFNKNNRLKMQ